MLHVDDEPDFAEMTATFLEREDDSFVVETLTRADEALDLLAENSDRLDCIVSDHEMPVMTGIELLENVRKEYDGLPFILFTGKGSEEIASEAISAGVTDYLQKGGTDKYTILANRVVNAVETARAKDNARRSQKRFETLSEAYPDVAFYIDEDGRYLEVIAGEESPLLYIEADNLVGQCVHDIFDSDTAERFYGAIQKTLETDNLQKIEYALNVQSGERWFEARLVPMETRVSNKRMVIWVARDITERKQREHELERQNRRLDDFASVVSHDLRNPLMVAEDRLELLREVCDEEHTEHIDAVERAHGRMEMLIDDLLTLSRNGRPVDDVEQVDIEEAAEECWQNVETGDADLVTDTNGKIRCDRNRLGQLLENLIRNAVEHGSTDNPTESDDAVGHGGNVTVTVGGTEEGFYVADDGSGIPEDERADVFESGYTTSHEGTGFGLSIVESIAEAHGWRIDMKEGEDGGARFEVSDVGFVE